MTTPYVEIKTCAECRFYNGLVSECRRWPPIGKTVVAVGNTYRLREWPQVGSDDWCGEYQDKAVLP